MEIEKKYLLTDGQVQKILAGQDVMRALETRYYLVLDGDTEIRITRRESSDIDGSYTLDRMTLASANNAFISRKKERLFITKEEFDALSTLVSVVQEPVRREHIMYSGNVEIKMYKGRHEGLIRAEIELERELDFDDYEPDFEYTADITATPLGRDVLLAKLTVEEFKDVLGKHLSLQDS